MPHVSSLLLCLSVSLVGAEVPTLTVQGGVYRMFTVGELPRVVVDGPAGTTVHLSSSDLFGRRSEWTRDVTLSGTAQALDLPAGVGYQRISARTGDPTSKPVAEVDLGIVPVQPTGLRPDSFIASNTSGIRTGDELELIAKLGIRVQRGHFNGDGAVKPVADGGAAPLDYTRVNREFVESQALDTWVLPVVGYAFGEAGRNALAQQIKMYGPPRDNAEFIASWEQILQQHPEFNTIEFWNEPWIFGWTWAGTPAEYRELQRQWCLMSKRVNPKLRIIAGNSAMFVEDHLEDHPEAWKGLLDGITHHPYAGGGYPFARGGTQARTIDHGMQVNRRMGLPYYYLTEGGCEYRDAASLGSELNNPQNAFKVVQYTVKAALVGCYQSNLQWEIGYGPAWTMGNTTLGVLHSLIEDRPCVAEIWPSHELITGAIFANARHVDAAVRSLPRAEELGARWPVAVPPERANDPTVVAVIYTNTGTSNEHVDQDSTLTIANIAGVQAQDASGRPILPHDGSLTVPFNEWPVYITSNSLSVVALRERIASAVIAQATAVNLSASSLKQPVDQAQNLHVRLENQVNRALEGTLTVTALNGGKPVSVPFHAEAGKLIEVEVPWTTQPPNATNQYGVKLTATTPAGTVTRDQVVSVARFVKRTITVDGDLSDWGHTVPVMLDSDRLKGGLDITQYLLNPNLARPTGEANAKRVIARLYSAWDENDISLAVAVDEDKLTNIAGSPWVREGVTLPYQHGQPGGLNHIRYTGDSVMFAFGFRDRVPGHGRQMTDPWAWKGYFCDSDYLFAAHTTASGVPQVIQLWDAESPRRNGYQTVAEPWNGPVTGATIAIRRDETTKRTIYELKIPRKIVRLFDAKAPHLRFSFNMINDEAINGTPILRWGEAAGVFDHWYNLASFAPTWEENLPCQTFFGIDQR